MPAARAIMLATSMLCCARQRCHRHLLFCTHCPQGLLVRPSHSACCRTDACCYLQLHVSLARHRQAPRHGTRFDAEPAAGIPLSQQAASPSDCRFRDAGKQSWLGIRTRRPLRMREGRTARKSFYLHNIIQMIDTETQSRSRQERGRLDETRDSPHQPAPSALLHKWHKWPICIRS